VIDLVSLYAGTPHLYTYMLAQRKRALSKSKRE